MSVAVVQQGYIPVAGGQVWYGIFGSGLGLPLLTLHGGPSASSDYLHKLTRLADERPVILYDQLGGGKSDRPDDPSLWVLDRFVEELTQVRAALALERFHLFGQSWGTILGVEYALTQPSGLASLMLSGPVLSVPLYVRDANLLKAQLPLELQQAIDRHEAAGTYDSDEYEVASAEWWRRHVCRNEAALKSLRQGSGDPETSFNSQVYNTMQGPSEFSFPGNLKDWDRTDRLNELRVPTLLACGRYDECTPEATAFYHSLLPESEMVVFEDSAHMTHLEEPELFLKTVRSFLSRVERDR